MQIMPVKRRSHIFVPHNFFVPYVTMHKALERINKNRINLSRPVLINSHKFLTQKNVALLFFYRKKCPFCSYLSIKISFIVCPTAFIWDTLFYIGMHNICTIVLYSGLVDHW